MISNQTGRHDKSTQTNNLLLHLKRGFAPQASQCRWTKWYLPCNVETAKQPQEKSYWLWQQNTNFYGFGQCIINILKMGDRHSKISNPKVGVQIALLRTPTHPTQTPQPSGETKKMSEDHLDWALFDNLSCWTSINQKDVGHEETNCEDNSLDPTMPLATKIEPPRHVIKETPTYEVVSLFEIH